jgi:hypothetical protein
MNRILLWIVLAAVIIVIGIWRSYVSSPRLNVEPHAAEEIEKAKRR